MALKVVLSRLVLLAVVRSILAKRTALIPMQTASELFPIVLVYVCLVGCISFPVSPRTCLPIWIGFLEPLSNKFAFALIEAPIRLFSIVSFVKVHWVRLKTEIPVFRDRIRLLHQVRLACFKFLSLFIWFFIHLLIDQMDFLLHWNGLRMLFNYFSGYFLQRRSPVNHKVIWHRCWFSDSCIVINRTRKIRGCSLAMVFFWLVGSLAASSPSTRPFTFFLSVDIFVIARSLLWFGFVSLCALASCCLGGSIGFTGDLTHEIVQRNFVVVLLLVAVASLFLHICFWSWHSFLHLFFDFSWLSPCLEILLLCLYILVHCLLVWNWHISVLIFWPIILTFFFFLVDCAISALLLVDFISLELDRSIRLWFLFNIRFCLLMRVCKILRTGLIGRVLLLAHYNRTRSVNQLGNKMANEDGFFSCIATWTTTNTLLSATVLSFVTFFRLVLVSFWLLLFILGGRLAWN